jgi:hypothetical protein
MDHQFGPIVLPAAYDVLVYIDKTTASKCFGFTQTGRKKD